MPHNAKAWRVGLVFGVVSAILHLAGYVLYAEGLINGEIETNVVSWSLWVVGTLIAYLVYRDIAHDWVKSLLNLICTISMFFIFGLLISNVLQGSISLEFDSEMITDLWIAVVDIFVMFIWILFRNRNLRVVNFFFQLDIIISFIPIVRATIADPSAEPLLPWALWAAAYLFQYWCVGYRVEEKIEENEDEGEEKLHTPFNYFAWHLVMACIILAGGAALL